MQPGDVVLLDFPFSDLSGSKFRPAVILADAKRGDYVACQITSKRQADASAIELQQANFTRGGLNAISFAGPAKLFTAHQSVIARHVGFLHDVVLNDIRNAVIALIRRGG